jgi:hypothetical protein
MVFKIAKTMANPIHHKKLSTLNPGTISVANQVTKPMITKVKSPNVKMLIGKVMINSKGLMKEFKTPRMLAQIPILPNELPAKYGLLRTLLLCSKEY